MQQIQMLFVSYRRADYADPDGFIASLAIVLAQYPEEVVIYVTHPETGIQRTIKFPPTIPEVVEACDNRVAYLARMQRYKNWGSSNQRDALALEDQSTRPTLEQLKEKYGPNWGLQDPDGKLPKDIKRAPTKEELAEHYAMHGLGFKPKSVVPHGTEEDAA